MYYNRNDLKLITRKFTLWYWNWHIHPISTTDFNFIWFINRTIYSLLASNLFLVTSCHPNSAQALVAKALKRSPIHCPTLYTFSIQSKLSRTFSRDGKHENFLSRGSLTSPITIVVVSDAVFSENKRKLATAWKKVDIRENLQHQTIMLSQFLCMKL